MRQTLRSLLVTTLFLLAIRSSRADEAAPQIVISITPAEVAAQGSPHVRIDRLAKGDPRLAWYELEVRQPSEQRDRLTAMTARQRSHHEASTTARPAQARPGRGRWGTR